MKTPEKCKPKIRKAYTPPKLVVYGDLKSITTARAGTGYADAGGTRNKGT